MNILKSILVISWNKRQPHAVIFPDAEHSNFSRNQITTAAEETAWNHIQFNLCIFMYRLMMFKISRLYIVEE